MSRLQSSRRSQRFLAGFDSVDTADRVDAFTSRLVRRRDAAAAEAKRLRIPDDMPPRLRGLLNRLAGIAATSRAAIRAYVMPQTIGGRTGERIAAGDVTVLHEFAASVLHQSLEVVDEIDAIIAPKTRARHLPGSRGKVDDLAARAERGEGLFREDDPR